MSHPASPAPAVTDVPLEWDAADFHLDLSGFMEESTLDAGPRTGLQPARPAQAHPLQDLAVAVAGLLHQGEPAPEETPERRQYARRTAPEMLRRSFNRRRCTQPLASPCVGRALAAPLASLRHVATVQSVIAAIPPEKYRAPGRTAATWGASLAAGFVALLSVSVARQISAPAPALPAPLVPVVAAEASPWQAKEPDLWATVNAFYAATTPEEKARFIRGGEAMLPALRSYYSSHPDEPASVEKASGAPYSDGGQEFLYVQATVDGTRTGFMVEKAGDEFRIDWRSLTGAGDMPWPSWLEQRPATPVALRVWASLDDYYSGEFADSSRFLCLKVTSPDGGQTAWAYLERNSPEAEGLVKVLGQGIAPGANGGIPSAFAIASRPVRARTRLLGTFAFPAASTGTLPQTRLVSLSEGGWLDHDPAALAQR